MYLITIITNIIIMIRVAQSYLRLLHSLLANLGEGIVAVGEFGSQAVPQTRRVADFGNALVKCLWSAYVKGPLPCSFNRI